MAKLLSLPNELIQHITSFLPCSSALNLFKVDRRLRNICNDKVVFQNIAKYNLERSLLLENGIELSENYWAESDAILKNVPLQQTIRLAYAAERCIQALLEKDDRWTLSTSKRLNSVEITEWLPQMIALHHPATLELKPQTFLQLQGQVLLRMRVPKSIDPDLLGANFVLGYTLLAQLRKTSNGKQVKEAFDRFFSVNRATDPPITLSNGVRTDGDAVKSLRQRVRDYGYFGDTFDLDQATTLLPTLMLELELSTRHLTPSHITELPSPTGIPFYSMMNVPPVFDIKKTPPFDDGSMPFGWCHLDKMVSPDFLSSGCWTGYYSDQRRYLGRRRFDPAMRDIRIVARRPCKEELEVDSSLTECTIVDQQSRGVDAVGEFSLQGRVQDDGFVYLIKRYFSEDTMWTWKASMTPFGIVGMWGSDQERFGGYFWIWKKEWC
ncbi:hypothetical protein AA0113_g5326 [Alternaria arborescens]|uniref:F-box domain-containing protein n=1 Tax=Alternaria arborescens TaxID=156630 RepID=A0A4Q4S654_9PLEO|nr:hypothetical protein AA0112_g10341 [Alternaria arborescens]RYO65209.1 hypothetical protein AA0113_g5326 [Alternaria arborescens]